LGCNITVELGRQPSIYDDLPMHAIADYGKGISSCRSGYAEHRIDDRSGRTPGICPDHVGILQAGKRPDIAAVVIGTGYMEPGIGDIDSSGQDGIKSIRDDRTA